MTEITNWRFTPTQITKDDRSTDTEELSYNPKTHRFGEDEEDDETV